MAGGLTGTPGSGGGSPFNQAPDATQAFGGSFWGNTGDPSNPAVAAQQPAIGAQTQQAAAPPPPPPPTPAPTSSSLFSSISNILLGGGGQSQQTPTQQAGAFDAFRGGVSAPPVTAPTPATAEAALPPATAPTTPALGGGFGGGQTASSGGAPFNISPSEATISPQSAPVSGNKPEAAAPAAVKPAPAPAPAAAPAGQDYRPDIAGSAREAGAGPPAEPQAFNNPAFSSPQGGGLPPVLQDLFSLNFGRFIADLLGQQGLPQGQNFAATPQPRAAAAEPPAAPDTPAPEPSQTAAAEGVAPTSTGLPDNVPGPSRAYPQVADIGQLLRQQQPGATAAVSPAQAAPGAPARAGTPAATPTPATAQRPAPGAASAALPPASRPADEGGAHPVTAGEPRTAPAPMGSGQNWWGTRPPDYFQRQGARPGANLATVTTPYGRVTVNQQVAPDLQGLTNDMKAAGVPGISKLGGFNDRGKRYGSGNSSHAYGAAVDLNDAVAQDPQFKAWTAQHPQQWQDMLHRHNFAQYMPAKDPNHLEWVGPQNRQAAGAPAAPRWANALPNAPAPSAPIAPRWSNALPGAGGTQGNFPVTRGDRNMNPGNIKMGPDARRYGATGVDDQGHAVFPNVEAGIRAQADLLTRNYNGKTVTEMGRSYATDPRWAHGVMAAGGFRQNERLNLRDPTTLRRLQQAIWRQEGTHPFSLDEEVAKNRAGGLPGVVGLVTGMAGDTSDDALRTIQRQRNTPADRPRP